MATPEEELYGNFIYSDSGKGFEGASLEYRLERKGLSNYNPDELASKEGDILQRRSQDVVRNDPLFDTSLQNWRENNQGLKVVWKDDSGKPNKEMQKLWDEFWKNPSVDGYGSGLNLQDMWISAIFRDTEALARMVIQKREGVTIPLAVQTIPAEYLDRSFSGNTPTKTRNGITFENNKPSFYHFDKNIEAVNFRTLDWNLYNYTGNSFQKVDVPADEVLHLFDRKYGAGQWRGIPFTASSLLTGYDLNGLNDALMQKQKNAQAIHFIFTKNGMAPPALGSTKNVLRENPKGYDKPAIEETIFETNAGATMYKWKGEDITTAQAVGLGSEVIDLMKFQQRLIAKATRTTYSKLTDDYSGLNMSILQQIELELKTHAEFFYEHILIPLGLQPLCDKFQRLAVIYANKAKFGKLTANFIYPVRYSVNELKDIQAAVLGIQAGLRLQSEEQAKQGLTSEMVTTDRDQMKQNGFTNLLDPNGTNMAQAKDVKAAPNTKGK